MSDEESATTNEQARRVREMFASIAVRYDLLNHLLSGNIDRRWRRLVARTLVATLPNSRSFEAATIAFGLRNLTSVEAGFDELLRVLKPGGRVAVLEFSKPKAPVLGSLFRIYFTKLLPLFGGWISGSKSAYEYLPDSVSRFPDQEELVAMMKAAGFADVSYQNLTGGIAALHLGTRPPK